MPPPKPALLGRVCKPSGSTSPEVPSFGGALCAISPLAVPTHPCHTSPPAAQGDAHSGGSRAALVTPSRRMWSRLGFRWLSGQCRAETLTSLFGENKEGFDTGLGPWRGARACALGCREHPGVLWGVWTSQGPPSV